MKYFLFLTLGLLFLFSTSCKDDKEGSLTLQFKAIYDGTTLQTFQTRPFVDVQQFQFTHLSMMVSDLRLFDQSGDENLSEIELVDISFDELPDAEEGYILKIDRIPAGNYNGIRFGIGVPPELNSKKPADFPSTSPLSKTGYYWIAWNSYIFSKIEGRLDTLGNGALDLAFALHSGSDELYRSVEGMLPISIEDGKNTKLEIRIDYKKLLNGVDIKANPQNHTPADSAQILKIMNNLQSAITLVK